MDTLIRGYNRKENPPKLPVYISLGNVFNSMCIGGYYSCSNNTRYTATFMNSSELFSIPDLTLKPGESYTISVPYTSSFITVVNRSYDETRCSTSSVELECKYGGCFGNIPPVFSLNLGAVPNKGETKTLTTTYGNARIEFILSNNDGRWDNYIRISPA